MIFLTIGTLTYLGTFAPWSPVMDAWSALPTPDAYLKDRSPLELQGRSDRAGEAVPQLPLPRR